MSSSRSTMTWLGAFVLSAGCGGIAVVDPPNGDGSGGTSDDTGAAGPAPASQTVGTGGSNAGGSDGSGGSKECVTCGEAFDPRTTELPFCTTVDEDAYLVLAGCVCSGTCASQCAAEGECGALFQTGCLECIEAAQVCTDEFNACTAL